MRSFTRAVTKLSQPLKTSMSDYRHITLYDIPTAQGAVAWSPSVWRTRLVLNYKHLPYETRWVEYPDIEKIARQIGAKPTSDKPVGGGERLWTCPIIVDPNHTDDKGNPTVVSDSYDIAKYLDNVYPERKIFPEGTMALQKGWAQFVSQCIAKPLSHLMIPLYPNALAPRSAEYIKGTREAWYMPLCEMSPNRAQTWSAVREGLDKIAMAFDENGTGDEQNLRVIAGRTCYADFALLAPLLWVVALAPREETDAMRMWNDGRWGNLLDSFVHLIKT